MMLFITIWDTREGVSFLLPDHGINGIVGIYLRIYH